MYFDLLLRGLELSKAYSSNVYRDFAGQGDRNYDRTLFGKSLALLSFSRIELIQ